MIVSAIRAAQDPKIFVGFNIMPVVELRLVLKDPSQLMMHSLSTEPSAAQINAMHSGKLPPAAPGEAKLTLSRSLAKANMFPSVIPKVVADAMNVTLLDLDWPRIVAEKLTSKPVLWALLLHPGLKVLRLAEYADRLGVPLRRWAAASADLKLFLEHVAAEMGGAAGPDDDGGEGLSSARAKPA